MQVTFNAGDNKNVSVLCHSPGPLLAQQTISGPILQIWAWSEALQSSSIHQSLHKNQSLSDKMKHSRVKSQLLMDATRSSFASPLPAVGIHQHVLVFMQMSTKFWSKLTCRRITTYKMFAWRPEPVPVCFTFPSVSFFPAESRTAQQIKLRIRSSPTSLRVSSTRPWSATLFSAKRRRL